MRIFFAVLFVFLTTKLTAEENPYSRQTTFDYPKEVFWGDTHLHTRNSADAYSLGNLNLTPNDAFRYARGEKLIAHNGMEVQLNRPLDFLVVSDHSEYLGGYYRFFVDDALITGTPTGAQWKRYRDSGDTQALFDAFVNSLNQNSDQPSGYDRSGGEPALPFPERTRKLIWQDVAKTADQNNRPGVFTAFTGYEWTIAVRGNNLHRVIVYRDSAEVAGQLPPFSGQDSNDPRELWKALARYEEATGGQVLAIPHNGNLSNGMMFPDVSIDGKPINKGYAELRARWEPIAEVSQVKGDGESHPTLSPNDEFADFENWDWDNIGRSEDKEDWMLKHEYARSALKLGLKYEKKFGVNPFKVGLIASSDGHNSLTTVQEDNFFGKFPETNPSPERMTGLMAGRLWEGKFNVASGYAAVWAEENSREAIFDAMKRREVYATTGSRITLRFFGGWGFDKQLHLEPHYLAKAYKTGVPMGGDLLPGPKNSQPKFLVMAAKDSVGANLDRVQIIKGWLDRSGNLNEKVYDVAWSGDREIDEGTGKLPAVGNTVDIKNATFKNSIGTEVLSTVWADPDFDAKQKAFYYARVLEIPVPRWSTYDAAYFDIPLPEGVPSTIQDRAYSSPIWYSP
tara:strand:+ start:20 stop:1888 length:1869 start_codon:yes stop_codon:yes gene_type:complete